MDTTSQFSSAVPADEMLRTIDEPLLALDADGTALFANQRAAELFEQRETTLVGEPLCERLAERFGPTVRDALEEAAESSETVACETYAEPLETRFRVRAFPFDGGVTVQFQPVGDDEGAEWTRGFIEEAEETAAIGGAEIDIEAGAFRWTDEVYRMHGLSPTDDISLDEVVGLYHPDDRPAIAEAFERLKAHEEPYDLELRVDTPDDRTRWVRSVAEPRVDDDGTVTGAIGIFEDITERKQAERELRETKERLDLAVEGAELGIWDWDIETDSVAFNDRWATMLGLSPDDMEGRFDTWAERLHPDDAERVEATLEAHIAGETDLYDSEHRMRTADGGWKWVKDTGKVFERDADGNPVRAVGINRDITERKQYEETLKQTREELRQVIDLVPDLIFAKDSEGVYLLANQTTADAYGLDPEDVEGRTEQEIIPDADESESFREDDRRVLESGEPLEVPEEELTTADGETRLLRTTKIPYTVAGSDRDAVLGYGRDITDLKRYEHQLEEQRDNLSVLNQIVRHDIRNTLNVVVGYAEFLEDHVDDAGSAYLDKVQDAAREAVDITTSAREVTEMLLQAETELTPTDLQGVLQRRMDDLQTDAESVVVRTDGALADETVLADDMLESVFRNLLQNAVLHNDADTPEVSVSTTVREGRVRVSVADNGPGIPDSRKEQIFDEGERGMDSDGTGLGLYLVRTLVDRYDGDVWAQDNERGGATFVVELPRADADASA